MPLSRRYCISAALGLMSGIPVGGAAQAPAVTLEDSVYVAALTTSTASPWKLVMSTATGTYDAASARQLVCVLPDCPGRDRTLVAHFVSVAGQRRTLAPFVRAAVAGTWVAPESLPPHRRRLGRLPDPEPRDAADSAMVRGWEAFWRRYGGSAEVLEASGETWLHWERNGVHHAVPTRHIAELISTGGRRRVIDLTEPTSDYSRLQAVRGARR